MSKNLSELGPTRRDVEPTDVARLGRALDLFVPKGTFDTAELKETLSNLAYLTYPEGSVVFRQGTRGSDVYILSRGAAFVVKDEMELARLAPGDIFGEVAFLASGPRKRSATVLAGEGCEIFRCTSEGFTAFLNNHTELRDALQALAVARTKKRE